MAAGNHFPEATAVRDVLKYLAKALLVTAIWRRGEAHEHPRCALFQQPEMVKDPPVGRRHSMVGLVNDDQIDATGVETRQTSASLASECGNRADDHLRLGGRLTRALLDVDLQVRGDS